MKYFPIPPDTCLKPKQPENMIAAPVCASGLSSSPIILVVDDNHALRELLAYGLRREGYVVLCARDGEEAWQLLSTEPFDLLITDNDMPRLCGMDLLRRMRAQAWVQPAILISGDLPVNAPDLGKLLTPGAALGKPFSIDELYLKVRKLVPNVSRARTEPVLSYSVSV